MEQNIKIQLNPLCILNVPLQVFTNDFTFIINGEEFQTNRLISDILSPKLCKIHMIDPTIDKYCINTSHKGHFSHILDLVTFRINSVPTSELPFISEVIEILENEAISLNESENLQELTEDNIFTYIKKHEKFGKFYSNHFQNEIDFISSHFYELCENNMQNLIDLQPETLRNIINNEKLLLNDEDQLLNFINKLYNQNKIFSTFYESVCFESVSSKNISEFIDIFDINDITNSIWIRLSDRLKQEMEIDMNNFQGSRYLKNCFEFPFTKDNEFKGIINYLRTKSNGNIDKEIQIIPSSIYHPNDSEINNVRNISVFDQNKSFWTENEENSWICIDFKKYRIIPTHYTIKSCRAHAYPERWFIEVSNDNNIWETVDHQVDNCKHLNGAFYKHTFKIESHILNKVRYIRIRQTQSSDKDNHLGIGSLEFYGSIYEFK